MIVNRKRIYYLDILRVIACMAVVMIHASSGYVTKDFGGFNFWVGNVFDSFARIGVPLFVMISGSIMLDKDYSYNNKLIKHIVKLIIFFIFWSALYDIVYNIMVPLFITHEPINILKIIGNFFKGHFHLWFIYMIIGMYLILPLLRLWVKDENKKYVEYFIILAIVFTFIVPQIINIGSNYSSIFEYIQKIIDCINMNYVGGFTTYFILGWYINNYDIKNKKVLYTLGFVSALVTIIGTGILSITTGQPIQLYGDITINVLLYSVMIFVLVKNRYKKENNHENKLISIISKNSLGIYAMHPVIIASISIILESINMNVAIINIPITYILAFVISFIGTYIFSKISILKNVV